MKIQSQRIVSHATNSQSTCALKEQIGSVVREDNSHGASDKKLLLTTLASWLKDRKRYNGRPNLY
jgi:hypothetical protein